MDLLAPLGLLAVGWLARWAWDLGKAADAHGAGFRLGYAAGQRDARPAPPPAPPPPQRRPGPVWDLYSLADAMREAERSLEDDD